MPADAVARFVLRQMRNDSTAPALPFAELRQSFEVQYRLKPAAGSALGAISFCNLARLTIGNGLSRPLHRARLCFRVCGESELQM
jgi:hypothetical protein